MFLTKEELRRRRWRKLGELLIGAGMIFALVALFYVAVLLFAY